MDQQRATVKQVAQAAGVSTATVVRALQNSPLVVPGTRDRVQQAARQLGYAPNPMRGIFVAEPARPLSAW